MSGLDRRDPKYSRGFYERTSVSKEEDQGLGGRRAGEVFRSSKALGLWQRLSSPLPILDLTCSCAFQGVMPSPWACLPTLHLPWAGVGPALQNVPRTVGHSHHSLSKGNKWEAASFLSLPVFLGHVGFCSSASRF